MAASFPGLSKEKQKWVWDSEHATFELETHFGKPFTNALKLRAHQKLQQYFVDGFVAELPLNSDRDVREKGAIREERLRSQNEVTAANATKVIDYFLSLLENFETIDRIKFRVLKIKKENPANDLWSTKTLLAVAGSDQRGPIELEVLSQVEFRFADDAEILGGKILESWRVTGETIRHCSQILMEEVTDSVGLADLPIHDNWKEKYNWTNHFQIAVEDFDRDGFPDIAVANHNRPALLLRSIQGKRFENVAQSMGIRPRKTKGVNFLVGWIDYDNDGFPDLLMNGTLYRNVHGTRFEDVTVASGLSFQYNPFGCIIADYDCDGWLDMYVLYEGP
ncbi:MAG: VCBS repeat-containing protein, partial [Planctomycetes bacterium]|nr:VCBS repeat-containing protein [Planctomycetota bacterium]